LNNIPVRKSSLAAAAYFDCQRANAGFDMCGKCVTIERKIEHYERLCSSISDQLAIERVKALVVEMKAQKAKFHCEEQ
jgi:hypothetical protein